jgi:hypothetical protein
MSASQPLFENFSEHFTFLNLLKYHTGPSELCGNCFTSNLYDMLVDFGMGSGIEGGARSAERGPRSLAEQSRGCVASQRCYHNGQAKSPVG